MALTAALVRRRGAAWARELLGGTVGSLSVLALPLTLGLLAFAPLGAAGVGVGVAAAFVCIVLGGGLYALLGRAAMPAGGPTSATALILASLVAQLAADPALAPRTGQGAAAVAALCGATVVLSGVLQVAMALFGVGRLSRFVPQPVLAGFMNGVAVLILLAQLPLLMGHAPGGAHGWQAVLQWQPGALALGLATAVLLWWSARRWPRMPVMLLALVLGTASHLALGQAVPQVDWGAPIGTLPDDLSSTRALFDLLRVAGPSLLGQHAAAVAGTAVVLAIIGALECALNNLAMEQEVSTRHDPRRELWAVGCANIAAGALCSLPVVAVRARAVATLQAGGHGRASLFAGSVVLGLLYLHGRPLLSALPLPVLAGTMLVIALKLIDSWSSRLVAQWWAGERSRDLWLSLGVVALVFATTIWQGFAAGVALGVLLSMLVFFVRMNRTLVRHRCTAAAQPSRRIYPAAVERRLQPLRERVTLFELEGALFFGSGERLQAEADTLAPDCRCLVLDLRRVANIDETGAVALQQLGLRLRRRGVELLLAGLAPASAPAQALQSYAASGPGWPDADRAVEAAERLLLGGTELPSEVPLAESSLLQGLDNAQRETLAALMPQRRLAAGEPLFQQGDAADGLYVLTHGSISIFSRADASGRTQRYLSISPGMIFGETAMLDGAGRSAGAVADTEATVHALSRHDLDRLALQQPALALLLYRNIAVHLSQRFRSTADAWHASTR
ncbi:MAG: SulP family inorganic anion transporter [Rubrivivax sp.]|nr:SulP family inorganic anion transporter [Rubrivivax sp.]